VNVFLFFVFFVPFVVPLCTFGAALTRVYSCLFLLLDAVNGYDFPLIRNIRGLFRLQFE